VLLKESDSGGQALAYNDSIAIAVAVDWPHGDTCLPGDLLIKSLNSFSGDQLSVSPDIEGGVLLKSGRSRVTLKTLPAENYPFTSPWDQEPEATIEVGTSMLRGIELCVGNVGHDLTHPEQMGVTLDEAAGKAVLYATDNWTISRFATADKIKLPAGSPVILPTAFCTNLLALAKAFPEDEVDIDLHPTCVVARFGKKAKLFTKLPAADVEPMDFDRVIEKHVKLASISSVSSAIPVGFTAAIDRALLLLNGVPNKSTKVGADASSIRLNTASDAGECADTLEYELAYELQEAVHIDPSLVARNLSACAVMAFRQRAIVLASADHAFVHLVSNVAG